MLFKWYLWKTENFGAGFYVRFQCKRFQFKRALMRVPALTRVSCAMHSCASVGICLVRGTKLEDFIIHVLFRGLRERLQYGSFKRTQLHGDRFMASVFPAFKLASLL